MSSKRVFIGGILAWIAGLFTAAALSVKLEKIKDGRSDIVIEPERLALPGSKGK